jgi:hypothetical protein
MQEEWKDAVGYECYFRISNFGRVYSKRSGKILKLHLNKAGRVSISTRIGGRCGEAVTFLVHRLVAEAFIPNFENKPQVNHIDGNPSNNDVRNLEWCTPSENMRHAFDNKLIVPKSGFENGGSTLTESQVDYIRDNPDKLTIREIAIMFGVHHSTIVRCKNHKRYKLVV